jgi:excisionase family DNA binding protein
MKKPLFKIFIPNELLEPADKTVEPTIDFQKHEWLTVKEAALYLRCEVKTIYNYKCQGRLKAQNLGARKKGTLLFKKTDLDAFIYGKRGA